MTDQQKAKARELVRDLIKSCPPTRQVYLAVARGKPRNLRNTPPPAKAWLPEPEVQRLLFAEAYAVWACAQAFDAWDEARPLFDDLVTLRVRLEDRGDFAPAYRPEHAGPLTAADLADPEYRFAVYQALLAGFQDNYWYRGAQRARQRMEKDKPVFFYGKALASLIGHHRLARHFGRPEEAEWARQTFDRVAAMTLGHKSAPYLWSDPALSPEVGRLIRDAAGDWLDALARTPNVGNLPATDWDQKPVPGKRDYYVMNPYTWFHAWGGQGEGIRPRTVLGAYLAQAHLWATPAGRLARFRDVPWCKADLTYAAKLATAIRAEEQVQWAPVGPGRP
jgi:hypothetical protein